jgi:hypothetical protein
LMDCAAINFITIFIGFKPTSFVRLFRFQKKFRFGLYKLW